jgi:hypothetical protein
MYEAAAAAAVPPCLQLHDPSEDQKTYKSALDSI